MTAQKKEMEPIAEGADAFTVAAIFVMDHNSAWLPDFQAFLDKVSAKTIPYVRAHPGSSTMKLFLKNVSRNIAGVPRKGFMYATIVNDAQGEPVRAYEFFFETNEEDKPVSAAEIVRPVDMEADEKE